MAYSSSLRFDSSVVIESLESADFKTGTNLVESVLAPHSSVEPGFVTELYEPKTRDELLGTLRAVLQTARRYGRSPIIHLETHGDREGLGLTSGQRVLWSDLAPLLAEINMVSRMNLLVVAALCHMVEILRPTDRAPAFGIVGTEEVVKAGDLYKSMQRFYGRLLTDPNDLREALSSANETDTLSDWTYTLVSAEIMLCRIFRSYASFDGGENEEQRVARLVVELARRRGADVTQTMQWREQIAEELGDLPRWFDHYRSKFLMLDLFPEHEHRFPLRYADCKGVAA